MRRGQRTFRPDSKEDRHTFCILLLPAIEQINMIMMMMMMMMMMTIAEVKSHAHYVPSRVQTLTFG